MKEKQNYRTSIESLFYLSYHEPYWEDSRGVYNWQSYLHNIVYFEPLRSYIKDHTF